MRVIFAGTPEFACPSLQALLQHNEHTVVAVFTQPDRPKGRGRSLALSPVKQLALSYDVPVYQPSTLKEANIQAQLAALNADVIIVVAYGLLLPQAVLDLPRYGCLNVHASLLPRWRGAAPIQQAILAGDTQTGITIMQMAAGLDTGDIFSSVTYPMTASSNAATLHADLANLGASELLTVLAQLSQGNITACAQDESRACYAPKIQKHDALIDWQQNAVDIDRKIRAFNPWPVAQTRINQTIVRIWGSQVLADLISQTVPLGTIVKVSKAGIDVATGDSLSLRIVRLQLPNKKQLNVAQVLNAHAGLFAIGARFDVLSDH